MKSGLAHTFSRSFLNSAVTDSLSHPLYRANIYLTKSAGNFIELSIAIESQCDALFRRTGIVIEPVTVEQAYLARQAFQDFGKGRHAARLNFGDCFAYALAKITGEPLLFQGEDFKETDIVSAL